MTPETPQLVLQDGLAVGYRQPLATLPRQVILEGGTHFLLARNGRGKTTLLRTVAGVLRPLQGRCQTRGAIQFLPEDLRFDPEMSARSLFSSLLPAAHRPQALELAEKIGLDIRMPYGKLSTGNRRKANLIVTEFSVRPDRGSILLLDEPFSGLDAFAREHFEEIWARSTDSVMRLVSCHPDYDSMNMPSALVIQGGEIVHTIGEDQTWSRLKRKLD